MVAWSEGTGWEHEAVADPIQSSIAAVELAHVQATKAVLGDGLKCSVAGWPVQVDHNPAHWPTILVDHARIERPPVVRALGEAPAEDFDRARRRLRGRRTVDLDHRSLLRAA